MNEHWIRGVRLGSVWLLVILVSSTGCLSDSSKGTAGSSGSSEHSSAPTKWSVARYHIPGFPDGIVAGFGKIWIAEPSRTLMVDPATGRVEHAIRVHGAGESADISANHDAVWVTQSNGYITRIDPGTLHTRQLNREVIDGYVDGIGTTGTMVWITRVVKQGVPRILGWPIASGRQPIAIDIPDADSLAGTPGGVWVPSNHAVYVDDREPRTPVPLGVPAESIAPVGSEAWILSQDGQQPFVGKVETPGGPVEGRTDLPVRVRGRLIVANEVAWFMCDCPNDRGWVRAFDLRSGTAEALSPSIPLRGGPWNFTSTRDGEVWISAYNGAQVVLIKPQR